MSQVDTVIRVRVGGKLVGPEFATNGEAFEWIEKNVPEDKQAKLCDVKRGKGR